ncbi:hypothetical protein KC19_7G085000 [Ceratodon purpureus]|uniref:Uncharacterized protein n=1 Tax=Ceratodon purpureus TaxID=3225 RepID=A0A8T0H970_CERPU|nr:hypothetical protein KC19_7G085000 [Ceratodon purpureus]
MQKPGKTRPHSLPPLSPCSLREKLEEKNLRESRYEEGQGMLTESAGRASGSRAGVGSTIARRQRHHGCHDSATTPGDGAPNHAHHRQARLYPGREGKGAPQLVDFQVSGVPLVLISGFGDV